MVDKKEDKKENNESNAMDYFQKASSSLEVVDKSVDLIKKIFYQQREQLIKAIVTSNAYNNLNAKKITDSFKMLVNKNDQNSLNEYEYGRQNFIKYMTGIIFQKNQTQELKVFKKYLNKQFLQLHAEIEHEEATILVQKGNQGSFNALSFNKAVTYVDQSRIYIQVSFKQSFADFTMSNNYFIVHCSKSSLLCSSSWDEIRETPHNIDPKDLLNIIMLLNLQLTEDQINYFKEIPNFTVTSLQ